MRFLPLLLILLLAPYVSSAHRNSTLTFSQEAGGYYADADWNLEIDYSKDSIEAGRPGRFIVDLFTDSVSYAQADYDAVSVYIEQDGRTIFAGPAAKPPADPADPFLGLLYAFPRGGPYTLHAVFYKDGKVLADAAFPLTVLRAAGEDFSDGGAVSWGSFALGAFLAVLALPLFSALRRRFVR